MFLEKVAGGISIDPFKSGFSKTKKSIFQEFSPKPGKEKPRDACITEKHPRASKSQNLDMGGGGYFLLLHPFYIYE